MERPFLSAFPNHEEARFVTGLSPVHAALLTPEPSTGHSRIDILIEKVSVRVDHFRRRRHGQSFHGSVTSDRQEAVVR